MSLLEPIPRLLGDLFPPNVVQLTSCMFFEKLIDPTLSIQEDFIKDRVNLHRPQANLESLLSHSLEIEIPVLISRPKHPLMPVVLVVSTCCRHIPNL